MCAVNGRLTYIRWCCFALMNAVYMDMDSFGFVLMAVVKDNADISCGVQWIRAHIVAVRKIGHV